MPRHEDLVLALFALTQRIQRLREALNATTGNMLTPEERAGIEATLTELSRQADRLETEIAMSARKD